MSSRRNHEYIVEGWNGAWRESDAILKFVW